MSSRKKSLQFEGKSSGESRCICLDKSMFKDLTKDLSSMFKRFVQISEQEEIEISLNITICKEK